MPDTQSAEKKDALRLLGAELHEVPAVPFKNPENYVHVAARLAEELAASEPNGVLYANQWENLSNAEGHYRSTGPEIWEQTGGTVDAFCCAIGTGGTIAGVGRYLKEKNPAAVIAVTDPLGSCMYNHFVHGELRAIGNSITEGIGQGRVTANIGSSLLLKLGANISPYTREGLLPGRSGRSRGDAVADQGLAPAGGGLGTGEPGDIRPPGHPGQFRMEREGLASQVDTLG